MGPFLPWIALPFLACHPGISLSHTLGLDAATSAIEPENPP
jgi:hypothetical protein